MASSSSAARNTSPPGAAEGPGGTDPPPKAKACNMALIAGAELLAMTLWFSASAVVPQLTEAWGLSGSQRSWMTMSVQVGFVAGALASAAVSELSDARYVGTALTVQTSIGFLLTLVSIRIVPPLVDAAGWAATLPVLALGPAAGIVAMQRLRRLPQARRMASGNR
jgi:hypothetical protein